MIKEEKKTPLKRPQVHAIQPGDFIEDLAFARNARGQLVTTFLTPYKKTMVRVPALDKEGKPLGRQKKTFAPELGKYVVKMKRA